MKSSMLSRRFGLPLLDDCLLPGLLPDVSRPLRRLGLAAAAQDGQMAGTGIKTNRILTCFSTVLSVMSGIMAILAAGVGGGCTA